MADRTMKPEESCNACAEQNGSHSHYQVCCICHLNIMPGQNPAFDHWEGDIAVYRHRECQR